MSRFDVFANIKRTMKAWLSIGREERIKDEKACSIYRRLVDIEFVYYLYGLVDKLTMGSSLIIKKSKHSKTY
jgi:hypothetical protein